MLYPRLIKWMLTAGCLVSSCQVLAEHRHDLKVHVSDGAESINIVDTITLDKTGKRELMLNPAFIVDKVEGGNLQEISRAQLVHYKLDSTHPTVTLHYHTKIESLQNIVEGVFIAKSPSKTQVDGVYLAPQVGWYPLFSTDEEEIRFRLEVTTPKTWSSISQGKLIQNEETNQTRQMVWDEPLLQQDITLIVGRYVLYSNASDGYQSQVFLRQADDKLAQDYLTLTKQYIDQYQKWIGPYPYAKFAMVESFWESGFALPSFTFMGPSVIRLPFIRTSSYPHEILHNWWGNSVYIDYKTGNWGEGLTSYMADYWIDEQQGNGANHRREVLQKYADFVRAQNDFPLTQFRSSIEAPEQAVGYGKTLMLYHMLRRKLGDEKFNQAIQQFYQRYKFKTAGFSDLQRIFSQVSEHDLGDFFKQWVERVGAPTLKLANVKREQMPNQNWQITGQLIQQNDPPYELDIPVRITTASKTQTLNLNLSLPNQPFSFELAEKPTRIEFDPNFDIFRQLAPAEKPPALSQFFGAEKKTVIYAEAAPAELKQAWQEMANQWKANFVSDQALTTLPTEHDVWLLGWNNRFISEIQTPLANHYGIEIQTQPRQVTLKGQTLDEAQHSVAIALHHPNQPQRTIVWFASQQADAVKRYTQRLPHFRKFSYVTFDAQQRNVDKGQWPVLNSPLKVEW